VEAKPVVVHCSYSENQIFVPDKYQESLEGF
jgi:hypothetical protein